MMCETVFTGPQWLSEDPFKRLYFSVIDVHTGLILCFHARFNSQSLYIFTRAGSEMLIQSNDAKKLY